MKILTIIAAFFLTTTAQAETVVYSCGYGIIPEIASFQPINSKLVEVELDDDQKQYLQTEFDYAFNCNEGVELIGARVAETGTFQMGFVAVCSQDSLGKKVVELSLACDEISFN